MDLEVSRKIKLLKMWEILKQETDEKHPIETNTLIAKLREQGIEVDRKILYKDIELLNENGYEVLCQRSRSNKYYVIDRSFDVPEVRILLDAVKSAGFITEKKTEALLDKIAMLAGSKRGQVLKGNVTKFSTVKSMNESIYYSVDTIIRAKEENKKIGFYYFDYDQNREKVFRKDKRNPDKDKYYIVNPVETVFDNDQYYLICYDDKHKDYTNYRVDRMDKVSVLEDDIKEYDWLKGSDVGKYRQQLFGMFSGEVKNVTFIANKGLIDVVFDKFGSNVKVKDIGNNQIKCEVTVQTGAMFIAWCCSFSNQLKVVSPPSVISRVKEHLIKTVEQYD